MTKPQKRNAANGHNCQKGAEHRGRNSPVSKEQNQLLGESKRTQKPLTPTTATLPKSCGAAIATALWRFEFMARSPAA